MNFFELVNKTLMELNFRPAANWEELYKLEHTRVKDLLNRVNSEICHSCDWWFLEREASVTLDKGETKLKLPVDGRLASIEDGHGLLRYNPSYRDFYAKSSPRSEFALFNGTILLGERQADTELKLCYFTNATAKDIEGTDKPLMADKTDESIISIIDTEHLLVYGACMRMKANPAHNRFKYWYSMYSDAVENIRSRGELVTESNPSIKMQRQ